MEGSDGGCADGSGEKRVGGEAGEKRAKRKMKTPYQLELLEKAYAVSSYPSEDARAELSVKLGLEDRQLQMWFCHRRAKDKKASEMSVPVPAPVAAQSPGPSHVPRKALARVSDTGAPRGAFEMPAVNYRHYDVIPSPQRTLSELRAISFVESQLGERVREDGPVLGVEFDPLPPGAFGAPIESTVQLKQPAVPYDRKFLERHDLKSMKNPVFTPSAEHFSLPSSSCSRRTISDSPRAAQFHSVSRIPHEYQFLPEQPTVKLDAYEHLKPSYYHDATVIASSNRISQLQAGGQFLHANEHVSAGYSYQDQAPHAPPLFTQNKQHGFSPGSREYDNLTYKAVNTNSGAVTTFGAHYPMGIENPLSLSDINISYAEDSNQLGRRRKSLEVRNAKEDEAYTKRMKKELEKQDILRKKREEQMRKEMERNDRERKREEERLFREKQREMERFNREQRREIKRREKFLQKENLRAEKMRRKEEIRREKEAARMKAANERAAARKIAREYMEQIEDERLELMDLAAASKGLPSLVSLDSDTLQNLHLFRDMLNPFPPETVQLKQPFADPPWVGSEENIGNLLMVWQFLITFADVLSLWPFTLDEFVQALHDYDSRLLGEVHVSLLKSIIKDIEYVARTPATASAVNQNSAANPGGGHPHIIEGAYAWGFDILGWKNHLDPLTWPEILRQLALSAGFGPQLKKRKVEQAYYCEDNEGHDGENIVTTLRSGAAAENAASLIQEKGFSYLRRSRHRLTPGTVKFAAFHVLSLEGGEGLTILEVAEKIQKSGLRDLTTSKTPEASIGAALSRDTKLFERVAPSTYCVRPAFRKDPCEAEAILAAAREKVRIFASGLLDSEYAEKDTGYVDDVEKDEESDSDIADDPEVEDILAQELLNKNEGSDMVTSSYLPEEIERCYDHTGETLGSAVVQVKADLCSSLLKDSKNLDVLCLPDDRTSGFKSDCYGVSNLDSDVMEIDESSSGEPWVLGLMEGEYSDLSVEERLNALLSLIGVAIEGNSLHSVLEERLEAANALKKQMWAEVQLDKRRLKEAYMMKMQLSSSFVPQLAASEDYARPGVDNGDAALNTCPTVHDEPVDPENIINNYYVSGEANPMVKDLSTNPDNLHQQNGFITEKSRSQLKSYIGHRAEEMYEYRSLPLGQDRRRNRYWQFVTSASANDPGNGRIFFESRDGHWRLIDSEEAFDALLAALDTRGIRESHLHSMLQKIESPFKEAIRKKTCSERAVNNLFCETSSAEIVQARDCCPTIISDSPSVASLQSSSFSIELGRNELEKNAALKRYSHFQKWLLKESLNSTILRALKFGEERCSKLVQTCQSCCELYFFEDRHCSLCHKTFKAFHNIEASFSEHVTYCKAEKKMNPKWIISCSASSLPMRIQLLKAQLARIEASIPSEALQPSWTEGFRKSWGLKLQSSSSAEDLLKILTSLESAIKRDWLSATFETTTEMLNHTELPGYATHCTASPSENVLILPWVPRTSAAVAFRLMDLDTSISYSLDQKSESHKVAEAEDFMKLSSGYAFYRNTPQCESSKAADKLDFQPGISCHVSRVRRSYLRGKGSRGRGRRGRGRGRGGKLLSRGASLPGLPKFNINEENILYTEGWQPKQTTRGRPPGRGSGRGRRTARPRATSQSRVSADTHLSGFDMGGSRKMTGKSLEGSLGGRWGAETKLGYAEEDENNYMNSPESDDKDQTSGDDYYIQPTSYSKNYDVKPGELLDEGSEEYNGEEDDNGDEEGDQDYVNDYMEVDDGEEEFIDEDGDDPGDVQRNGDDDESSSSFSSEYSD